MNSKKVNIAWLISLFVICIATILIAVTNIVGIELPDIVIRILGVLELISIPVLAFTTVKKIKSKNTDV